MSGHGNNNVNPLDVAETIRNFLMILDMFGDKTTDVIEYLREAKQTLESNISYNNGVMIVAMAMGGKEYDDEADRLKVKELKHIIGILEIRRKMRAIAINKSNMPDGNLLYR